MSRDLVPISAQLRHLSQELMRKVEKGKFPPPSELMRSVCKVCHGSGFARYFQYGRWGVKRCEGWQPVARYADDDNTEPRQSRCLGADYEAWVAINRQNLLFAIQRLLYSYNDIEKAEDICANIAQQMFDTSNIVTLTCDQLELLFYKLSSLTTCDSTQYDNTCVEEQRQPEQAQTDDIYCF